MEKITVSDLPIRLGQFLKFANLVQDGFEAKIRIQEGEVLLNGEIETRRGKKLSHGDIITYDNTPYLVNSPE
jgi:ribosome-associated protein